MSYARGGIEAGLFEVLLRAGLLMLGSPDHFGWEPVSLTGAGQARYDELWQDTRPHALTPRSPDRHRF